VGLILSLLEAARTALAALPEFWFDLLATLLKFAIVAGLMLQIPPIMVWVERRAPAMMQRRLGPNRVGFMKWRLFGLLQSLADAIKLIFKEEVVPTGANKTFYHIAPIFSVFTAFMIASAIPYGPTISVAGRPVALSVISMDVGFLFIFAMSSVGVYAVTLAGWASNNKYSLLGALRASAQMISYEIPLGLSLIPIVIIYRTLDLNEIVVAQGAMAWQWGIVKAPISFLLFLVCMFAETNRAPFDLAEGESELVAGFHTEFNSAKFAAFFLGEYVIMFVLSCFASTIFFGGWQIPFVPHDWLVAQLGGGELAILAVALIGFVTLLVKAAFFMWLYVWVRWTLPRFRYDQLMDLGWKFMLPVGLANVLITTFVIAAIEF
jgi:NADH-quinone oxidoreductase subunit H